jgi:hypothetical protein
VCQPAHGRPGPLPRDGVAEGTDARETPVGTTHAVENLERYVSRLATPTSHRDQPGQLCRRRDCRHVREPSNRSVLKSRRLRCWFRSVPPGRSADAKRRLGRPGSAGQSQGTSWTASANLRPGYLLLSGPVRSGRAERVVLRRDHPDLADMQVIVRRAHGAYLSSLT